MPPLHHRHEGHLPPAHKNFEQILAQYAGRLEIRTRLALCAAAGTPEVIVLRTVSKSSDVATPQLMDKKDAKSLLGLPDDVLDGQPPPGVVLAIHLHDSEITYCWIGRD